MGFRTIEKYFENRADPVLFVFNEPVRDANASRLYETLAKTAKPSPVSIEGVADLYGSLQGYFQQRGLSFSPHGTLSTKSVMRLEGEVTQGGFKEFMAEVVKYRRIESKSTPTNEEDDWMAEQRTKWTTLASKAKK